MEFIKENAIPICIFFLCLKHEKNLAAYYSRLV